MAGKAMLVYCLNQDLVRSQGELLVLNDAAAAEFGINWADLRLRLVNERVREFLSGYLAAR